MDIKLKELGPKDKFRIRFRDGFRCRLCGKAVKDNVMLFVEYKVLPKNGGNNNDSNFLTLCDDCIKEKEI